MNPVKFTFSDIKYGTDAATLKRAVRLYEDGRVSGAVILERMARAKVAGTEIYDVWVDTGHYDIGGCTCYLGNQDILCKHLVALAIYCVKQGQPLNDKETTVREGPVSSGRKGELSADEVREIKKNITAMIRYIKPYTGPSRTWEANQNSLAEGCRRLSEAVSELPVTLSSAEIVVDLLLRLDRKILTGGVDDSNGIVGGFIEQGVELLKDYAKLDAGTVRAFRKLANRETVFGWEEPLVEMSDKYRE